MGIENSKGQILGIRYNKIFNIDDYSCTFDICTSSSNLKMMTWKIRAIGSEKTDNGTEVNYVNVNEKKTGKSSQVLEFRRGLNWKIKQNGKHFCSSHSGLYIVAGLVFKLVTS